MTTLSIPQPQLTYQEKRVAILTAPTETWEDVMESLLPGADPIVWERARRNYSPEKETESQKRIQTKLNRHQKNRNNGQPLKTRNYAEGVLSHRDALGRSILITRNGETSVIEVANV